MPRLTPQEQQEVIRYLEADKPLPEKYRFLLFDDKREVELVWNGKTNEVCNVVLPFQTIEQVDEPRAEKPVNLQLSLFDIDARGRQLKGWTNKLIWGDNKLILSSLKSGPMREAIEAQGGLKLIYIDPPFDVGADFSMDIEVGEVTFTKKPNILEEIAYRDTWGRGADSFISMIYERLILMRDLLAEDGSIYVHMGPNVSHYVKATLDEVFGAKNFRSEIVWRRSNSHNKLSGQFGPIHDVILYYSVSDKYQFHPGKVPFSKGYIESRFKYKDKNGIYQPNYLTGPGVRNGDSGQPWRGYNPTSAIRHWAIPSTIIERLTVDTKGLSTQQILDAALESDLLVIPQKEGGQPMYKQYLTGGIPYQDIWAYQPNTQGTLYGIDECIDSDVKWLEQESEKVGYDTQKPEGLIRRILETSSNEGDLVADFFCGSGTTAAIAEKMGRKWISSDLGKFAIHATRKRMIGVQRQLKAEGKDYRAFEILNLGKYERQHYVGVNADLREEQKQQQLAAKEAAFLELILNAYRAEAVEGFTTFHGKRNGRMVVIGPVNMPVTRLFVEEVILECRKKHITKVDILGFEFEMGLFPNVLDEARGKGIDIAPKYIPAEVFDKRAVEKNQVVFHDVSFIEVKPLHKKNSVAVKLTDFSVFYSQDSISNAETTLKNKANKVVVEKGQIVKVSKDKDGIVSREVLTQKWTDWIDYWSVDFNFESKREIIRQKNPDTGEMEESWTGDYIFENEWQSFRTKKDRSLELQSVFHEYPTGTYKIAVKVVDIFGNDTMTIIEVRV